MSALPLPPPSVAIAADDLTGAADSVAAFAAAGWQARVALAPGELMTARLGLAQAVDCASRRTSLAALGEPAVTETLAHLAGAGVALLKVDSLLRGYAVADLETLAERGPWRRVILAPAYPACGRTFVDAQVRIGGRPAQQAGLEVGAATFVGCEALRTDPDALPADGLAVVDAETDADLARVVEGAAGGPRTLWVGSAGLAGALARSLAAGPVASVRPAPATFGSTICVVGSMTETARRQALALASSGARHVELPLAALADDGGEPTAQNLARTLAEAPHVVLSIAGPVEAGEGDERHVRRLARLLAPLQERIGALVLVGGQTAVEALRALGVGALDVLGELEPGVVLARDARGRLVVTKSGSFGDDRTLVRVLAALGR